MKNFEVTFYGDNGRLIRHLIIAGMVFVEQFDWDGWYGYYGAAFIKIDDEKAIDMAQREIQIKHPEYINRGKIKFKLYEFDLGQLAYGRKAKAA